MTLSRPLPPTRKPTPPAPGPHAPNMSKILLYNVEEDRVERLEMSAAHADVVARLHALVVEHQRTGVPQATGNRSCGAAKPSQDNSKAGQGRLYWGPYC